MTIQTAIKRITSEIKRITSERAAEVLGMAASFNGCGRSDIDEFREAVGAGKAALCEKAERENPKPLTLEELRQMDGEPVWINDEKCWGIINIDEYGQWAGVPFVTFYYKSVRCDWHIEKRGLTCYRHKPKEVQNG